MKKIFYILLIFKFYSVSAQAEYDLKITPLQSDNLCLPISPTPSFEVEIISLNPATGQPVIEITGYPVTPSAFATNFSFRYRLIGANFTSSATYNSPTYPPGYNGRLVTTIEPFIPLGGAINLGTTTLYIDEMFINSLPVDFPLAETPRTRNINISSPLILSESDFINGSNVSLTNSSYNLNINTSLPNGVYTFYFDISGANDHPFVLDVFNTPPFYQVQVTSGNAVITIPSTYFPNSGTNTISLRRVVNAGGCSTNYLSAKTFTFNTASSLGPDVSGSKSITINSFCQGTNGVVQFTSSAIANGNYNLTYSLSGANNLASSVVAVNFNSGITNFVIPSSQVPNSGNTTISILSISDGSGSSIYSPSVDFSFLVNSIPNANGINSLN